VGVVDASEGRLALLDDLADGAVDLPAVRRQVLLFPADGQAGVT
jgi:hypothetical protein